jgi:hypothetical protein
VNTFDEEYSRLLKKFNVINEALPAIAAVAALPAAGYAAAKYDIIPEQIKQLAKENTLYMILSYVDITGITSWPYVEIALDELEKDPNSEWNKIFLILAVLSTIPVAGIGARLFMGILTYLPRVVISKIGRRITGLFRNSKKLKDDALPNLLASVYGKEVRGKDLGATLNQTLQQMGVRVDPDLVLKSAKKKGINLDAEYVKRITPAKGAAQKLKSALKTTGAVGSKVGAKALKTGGSVARPAAIAGTSYNASKEKGENKENLGTFLKNIKRTRTPAVYGGSSQEAMMGRAGATTPAKY